MHIHIYKAVTLSLGEGEVLAGGDTGDFYTRVLSTNKGAEIWSKKKYYCVAQ